MRLKITVAYAGGAYAGWQRQADHATVQGAVERAFAIILGRRVTVHGAGRTDAGVHARGQVAHLDVDDRLDPGEWLRAVNTQLPADVRLCGAEHVESDFHARHVAVGKTYSYTLDLAPIASPFTAPYRWHLGPGIDIAALRNATQALLGPLDQRAFATKPVARSRPDRPLEIATTQVAGDVATITIRGRSFLRYAVRGMVGTVIEVARGHRPVESVREAAASGQRPLAGTTAPPHGLCLEHVHYEP